MDDIFPQTVFDRARQLIEKLHGAPIAVSRHRAVFRDGDEVIKVPTRESGIHACYCELTQQGEILARTRADRDLSEETGLPIVRMEYVEHVGRSETPDWTWSIDCGQVGRTKDGRLVAYDWEHC